MLAISNDILVLPYQGIKPFDEETAMSRLFHKEQITNKFLKNYDKDHLIFYTPESI